MIKKRKGKFLKDTTYVSPNLLIHEKEKNGLCNHFVKVDADKGQISGKKILKNKLKKCNTFLKNSQAKIT